MKPDELEALKAAVQILSLLKAPQGQDVCPDDMPSEIRDFLRTAPYAQLRAVLVELIACWYKLQANG